MVKKDLKIQDIGEFGFIESIKDNCHYSLHRLIKGIGDDCAVIGPYDGHVFLITTDMLVENIHFLMEKMPPEHLGQKAIAVNLSDIAAMGGTPLHCFVSIAIPKSMDVSALHSVYTGMKTMCRKYGVNILGGDTSASPEKLMINVTLIGEALEEDVLYRKGAVPGDRIYVTGTLGDSAGGLKLIREDASVQEKWALTLIETHNRPVPFLEAGRIIARSKFAGAMIDISDGFISDLRHICQASGVGARFFCTAIPLSEELRILTETKTLDPYEFALYGGEDYRLLITVPLKNCDEFESLFEGENPCRVFQVGEITVQKEIRMVMADGEEKVCHARGFDHFQ